MHPRLLARARTGRVSVRLNEDSLWSRLDSFALSYIRVMAKKNPQHRDVVLGGRRMSRHIRASSIPTRFILLYIRSSFSTQHNQLSANVHFQTGASTSGA